MDTFYYCIDHSEVDRCLAGEHVLVSAAICYKSNKFTIPQHLDKVASIFIDSGGFSYLKSGQYPFTIEEYCQFIAEMQRRYPKKIVQVATPDYPCWPGPECNAKKRIARTIDQAFEIINTVNPFRRNLTWVITLHGNRLTEYKYALDHLHEKRYEQFEYAWNDMHPDLDDDTAFEEEYERQCWQYDFEMNEFEYAGGQFDFAIGSLKSKRERDILSIISLINRKIDWNFRIHAFGLGLRYLKNRKIADRIDSADSGAWRMNLGKGNRYARNHVEKAKYLSNYQTKMNQILGVSPISANPFSEGGGRIGEIDQQTTLARFA